MSNEELNQNQSKQVKSKGKERIIPKTERLLKFLESFVIYSIIFSALIVGFVLFLAYLVKLFPSWNIINWATRGINPVVKLIQLIGNYWKAILLIFVILLFYRPLKTFVEEAYQLFGLKRIPPQMRVPPKPQPQAPQPMKPQDIQEKE